VSKCSGADNTHTFNIAQKKYARSEDIIASEEAKLEKKFIEEMKV